MFDRKTLIKSFFWVFMQGSHRPGKVLEFDLGSKKILEFEKSAFCPGIVLEFCKIILENMN